MTEPTIAELYGTAPHGVSENAEGHPVDIYGQPTSEMNEVAKSWYAGLGLHTDEDIAESDRQFSEGTRLFIELNARMKELPLCSYGFHVTRANRPPDERLQSVILQFEQDMRQFPEYEYRLSVIKRTDPNSIDPATLSVAVEPVAGIEAEDPEFLERLKEARPRLIRGDSY